MKNFTRSNKKTVSFVEVKQKDNNIRSNIRSNTKKQSILKRDKNKELQNSKTLEPIQEENESIKTEKKIDNKKKENKKKENKNSEEKEKEEKEEEKEIEEKEIKNEKIDIPIEIDYNTNYDMKYLSTDEYFKATVQSALEQGLYNIAMLHPANPIKFLGNYLIEKSKNPDSTL
jgi:hypothetical protein